MAEQQPLFVMHDPQANAVKPSAATHKRVRGIAHCMKEDDGRPLLTNGFDRYFVPESLERSGDGSIFPLDSAIGESQYVRVGIVEDAVQSAALVSSRALNSTLRSPLVSRTGTRIPTGVSS
ncbi:MAG TPA: hypothetical protein VG297_23105 [Bryobacteraceae bacterium]|nr:hypothetical protein [Bryobacteraceae bacterium]